MHMPKEKFINGYYSTICSRDKAKNTKLSSTSPSISWGTVHCSSHIRELNCDKVTSQNSTQQLEQIILIVFG